MTTKLKYFISFTFFLLLIIIIIPSYGKESDNRNHQTVIANKEYEAGWFHRMIFGDTWRDLWATPLKVEVLDLETFDGGLTPYKKGGGMQTRSLKFKSNSGKIYKFRAIKKTTERILDKILLESLVDDALDDIFSTSNPYSSFIAAPIIESVGILQVKPRLVILPDNEMLIEFQEEFGGLLGTLEEHPKDYDDDDLDFAHSDKIWNSYKLFNKLKKDNSVRVDAIEYLKARLVDIYLGDWDRHDDQWRWAVFKEDGLSICRPIPRDRDQVLCRYDGLIPTIADYLIIQIEHCGEEYPPIKDLTWSGDYLDRKFYASLTKTQWDSVTNYVYNSITDSIIDLAINALPPEIIEIEGSNIRHLLKSRRDKLIDASQEYYELIFEQVDIRCSNKDELIVVNKIDDSKVLIEIMNINEETKEPENEPFFKRTFDDKYTEEIRIYLFGGDDEVVFKGETENDIKVYITGGKGKDKYTDRSISSGYFWGILPFKNSITTNYIFDNEDNSDFELGGSSSFIEDDLELPKDDKTEFDPDVPDWGNYWQLLPWLSINSDDGLILGGIRKFTKYGFRADPYKYSSIFKVGYSINLNKYKFGYDLKVPKFVSPFDFNLSVYGSQLDVINYFGLGNESRIKNDVDPEIYYTVNHANIMIKGMAELKISEIFRSSTGISINYFNTNFEDNTFVNDNRPYGSGEMLFLTGLFDIVYDSRDNEMNPTKGFYTNFSGEFSPKFMGNDDDFGNLKYDVRTYLSTDLLTDITWAFRAGGQYNFGETPYFKSAFLGGKDNLRGFHKQRYAGDEMVHINIDSRIFLSNYYFVIPGQMGLILFSDVGRVFLDEEYSEKWHSSYGSGLWFSAIYPEYLLSLYVAKSQEHLRFYIDVGFLF